MYLVSHILNLEAILNLEWVLFRFDFIYLNTRSKLDSNGVTCNHLLEE